MASKTEIKNNYSYSFPLCSVLFVLFLALKLTGHINWSWWWVTAPLWGPWVALLLFLLGASVCVFVVLGLMKLVEWHEKRSGK